MKILDSQVDKNSFILSGKKTSLPIQISSKDSLCICKNLISSSLEIEIVTKKISGDSILNIDFLKENKLIKNIKISIDNNIYISKKINEVLNVNPDKILIYKQKSSIGKIEIARFIINSTQQTISIDDPKIGIIVPYTMWGGAEVYIHNMLKSIPKNISLDLLIPVGSKFKDFNYSPNINIIKWINLESILLEKNYNYIIFYNSKKVFEVVKKQKDKNNFLKVYEIYHSDFEWPDCMSQDTNRNSIDKIIKVSNSIGLGIQNKLQVICPPPVYVNDFIFNKKPLSIKTLGYIGRLSKEKRVDLAIDIAKELGVNLLIAGDGPLKNHLMKRKCDNVTFLGWQDPVQFYKKIDCLILSSYIEGLPNVILEALASGLPIISTDVGGIKNLLEDTTSIIYNGIEDIQSIKNFINNNKNFSEINIKKAKQFDISIISKNFWNEILNDYIENIEVIYKNNINFIDGLLL